MPRFPPKRESYDCVRPLVEKLASDQAYADIAAQLAKIQQALQNGQGHSRLDIETAVAEIRDKHPSVFAEIVSIIRDTVAGAGGSVAAQWIAAIAGVLPR